MLRKVSGQNSIDFLFSENKEDKNIDENLNIEKEESSFDSLKEKHLNCKDDGLKTSNHISSAQTGVIRDTGGPKKYLKSETSNSIWDNDVLARAAEDIYKEKKEDKEEIIRQSNKREEEDERVEKMSKEIEDIMKKSSDKKSNRLSDFSGENYYMPKSSMSIFDNDDFMRVIDKTDGEVVKENNIKKREQKDDSWRSVKKSYSSKDITNKLFDDLFG